MIIIEDGTMPVGANSYATVAQADVHFLNLNDAVWAALTVPEKEEHLIKGAAYVNNQQIYPYDGDRQTLTQWLPWPRTGATYWTTGPLIPDSTIVIDLIKANIVAAGLSAKGELPTDTGNVAPGGVEVKREKVDTLEIEYFHSTQGQDSASAPDSVIGPDAIAAYGHPDVTGLLIPLLEADAVVAPATGDIVTTVPRDEAARRGGRYMPATTPPAFGRAMFDNVPFREDEENIRY